MGRACTPPGDAVRSHADTVGRAALPAAESDDGPVDVRFDRIVWIARRFYEADLAVLSFAAGGSEWMRLVTSSPVPPPLERQIALIEPVLAADGRYFAADLQSDVRLADRLTSELPFRSAAGVPLVAPSDLVVGTLCLLFREPSRVATFDFAPLEAIAAIAVDELALSRRNHDLNSQVHVDALTGLINRRALDEALPRMTARCMRTSQPLAALLIDIDHFKVVNDERGHDAGDDVLRRFAGVLASAGLRADDLVARYGGEEFVALLPGCDRGGAMIVANRIRQRLALAGLAHPNGVVTASIGVAVASGRAMNGQDLVARADDAMYRAKQAGRDCVVADEDFSGA